MNRHLYLLAAIACGGISVLTTVHPQAGPQTPAAGQAAAPAPPAQAPGGGRGGPPGTEAGFATFQTRCSACHGNPAVERAPSPAALREMTPEKIYDALVSGTMQAQGQPSATSRSEASRNS